MATSSPKPPPQTPWSWFSALDKITILKVVAPVICVAGILIYSTWPAVLDLLPSREPDNPIRDGVVPEHKEYAGGTLSGNSIPLPPVSYELHKKQIHDLHIRTEALWDRCTLLQARV